LQTSAPNINAELAKCQKVNALVVPRTDSRTRADLPAVVEVEGCLESSFFGEKIECFVIIERDHINHPYHIMSPSTFQRTTVFALVLIYIFPFPFRETAYVGQLFPKYPRTILRLRRNVRPSLCPSQKQILGSGNHAKVPQDRRR